MPQVAEHTYPGNTSMRLWRTTESFEDLQARFARDGDLERYTAIKLGKRKREWLGLQFLLRTHPTPLELSYAETGKPVLPAGHITLSHCEEYIGMVTSDLPVGLDIQSPTPQLNRIRTKFCRADELDAAVIAPDPLGLLTRIWSAKEALFKIYGTDVDFREEMAYSTEEQDHIFLLKHGGMVRHELFTKKHADMWMTLCLYLGG